MENERYGDAVVRQVTKWEDLRKVAPSEAQLVGLTLSREAVERLGQLLTLQVVVNVEMGNAEGAEAWQQLRQELYRGLCW